MNILTSVPLQVDLVTSILTLIPVIIIVMLTAYYTYRELRDIRRTGGLFLRVVSHERKEEILDDMEYMTNLPDPMIKRLSERQEIIRSTYTASLNQIIKKYTEELDEPAKVAIYDETQEARFYTDFVEASIASSDDLHELAEKLSFHIIENSDGYSNGDIDRVVALGNGNVILANEVAKYLELPLIIAGDVRGEENTIVGKFEPGEQVIIVDDIGFTGTMMVKALSILYEEDLECETIFTVLKRSAKCDIELGKFNTENSTSIQVNAVRSLNDEEIEDIIS